MFCDCSFHRRAFLKTAGSMAAGLTLFGGRAMAAQPAASVGALPARGEFIIRGGYILTMDPALADLPVGDVHIRNGAIVAVGAKIDTPPGAQVIDARERIVLPGFVDTHWHLWSTALRMVIRGDDPKEGYFPITSRVGGLYTPQDAYRNVRLGALEGLLSGITTVHNWCHNTVTPEHADAEIQALRELGLRARFSYGAGQNHPGDKPMNLADLARVQKQFGGDAMLAIGACLRTPGPGGTRGAISVDLFRTEFDAIRKLGLPMTIHCGAKNLIDLMGTHGFLGPDMLLVHPQGMSPAELKMVGDARAPYSIAPVIEMSYSAVRSGTIQYSELQSMGTQVGLSIDASAATNADFFNVMRALMWSEWQRTGAPQRLRPKRLVELATIEGAKLLGMSERTGSLTPGKRADLMLVRTGDINMAPVGDPYNSLVFQGQPSNIDTVFADGRLLVRGGRPVHVNVDTVVKDATDSARGIMARASK
jgi:5-methylthioadenosine/S-adenosylhomocysteine deaminase